MKGTITYATNLNVTIIYRIEEVENINKISETCNLVKVKITISNKNTNK